MPHARALAALFFGLAAACARDCPQGGASRCEDAHTLSTCEIGGEDDPGKRWHTVDCAGPQPHCVTAAGASFCALARTPEPACSQASNDLDEACDGKRYLRCNRGYAVLEEQCAVACAPLGAAAFCSPLDGPDPQCAGATASSCADATTRVVCRSGWRDRTVACCTAGGCASGTWHFVNGDFRVSLCALGAGPDPRCPAPPAGSGTPESAYCDGLVGVDCYLGHAVRRVTCADRPTTTGDPPCLAHEAGWTECRTGVVSVEGTPRGEGEGEGG